MYYFDPHPPWGMTCNPAAPRSGICHISTHIPRVGDDVSGYAQDIGDIAISIHIPHVGDDQQLFLLLRRQHISIHIPRVGDDYTETLGCSAPAISIHIPRVGDDCKRLRNTMPPEHFNPHPPCGG